MTKFQKDKFQYHGGYLTYEGKFVARFKHMPGNRSTFVTFLVKNFTVEEYFEKLEGNAPVKVLEAKGYIANHIKKMLKKFGYTIDLAGYNKFIEDQVALYAK